jgi:hypothetical protein
MVSNCNYYYGSNYSSKSLIFMIIIYQVYIVKLRNCSQSILKYKIRLIYYPRHIFQCVLEHLIDYLNLSSLGLYPSVASRSVIITEIFVAFDQSYLDSFIIHTILNTNLSIFSFNSIVSRSYL